MEKILLLGKNGMLGQAICQNYELQITNYKFTSWSKDDLDITNKPAVFSKIEKFKPDIVINATGYTNVDGAESERKLAFAVNEEAVGNIAEICARINAAFFHFSTDYIFDGSVPQGYREDDTEHIGPLNVYGESKRDGELRITNQELRIKNKEWKYFIIRTSWLYGRGGKNFVDTMLSRAKAGQTEFKVVDDQFGKPTFTKDLAERVIWMIEQKEKLENGVYHCANEDIGLAFQKVASDSKKLVQVSNLNQQFGSNIKYQILNVAGISWYQFAREIFQQAHQCGIIKTLPAVAPCSSAEFPRPAARPRYSALLNTKLPTMRDWKEAVGEYMGK